MSKLSKMLDEYEQKMTAENQKLKNRNESLEKNYKEIKRALDDSQKENDNLRATIKAVQGRLGHWALLIVKKFGLKVTVGMDLYHKLDGFLADPNVEVVWEIKKPEQKKEEAPVKEEKADGQDPDGTKEADAQPSGSVHPDLRPTGSG